MVAQVKWTYERAQKAVRQLGSYSTAEEAADAIGCSYSALKHGLKRHGFQTPGYYLGHESTGGADTMRSVAGERLKKKLPDYQSDEVQSGELPTHRSGDFRFGVIGDIHFGHKRCRVDFLQDYVYKAYGLGVRTMFYLGDALDGDYAHGRFELAANGLDEQCAAAWHGLPQLEGLTYIGISGNHEATLGDRIGIDAGQYMQTYFEKYGRHDLQHIGRRAGWYQFQVEGAASAPLVYLWHPKGKGGVNFEPMLKRRINGMPRGQEPDFMFAGHLHGFCHVVHRDVRAFCMGTFHGHGGDFSNAIGTEQALQGVVISFELDSGGHIAAYTFKHYQYREAHPSYSGRIKPADGNVIDW